MPDFLTITDLELWTRIGVTAEEREAEQRLLVTVAMECETSAAGASDSVDQSIDYVAVRNAIVELGKIERKTIERLAEDVASLVLEKFKPDAVEVTVKKFPCGDTGEVSIAIERKSGQWTVDSDNAIIFPVPTVH
ncbi:dihydroneopterin aldolase [Candidatus Peregrinibacteria bacterium]|nr:dihydroneopterin aldolase [Candidatus Peregrinibacteria bacterium]